MKAFLLITGFLNMKIITIRIIGVSLVRVNKGTEPSVTTSGHVVVSICSFKTSQRPTINTLESMKKFKMLP